MKKLSAPWGKAFERRSFSVENIHGDLWTYEVTYPDGTTELVIQLKNIAYLRRRTMSRVAQVFTSWIEVELTLLNANQNRNFWTTNPEKKKLDSIEAWRKRNGSLNLSAVWINEYWGKRFLFETLPDENRDSPLKPRRHILI